MPRLRFALIAVALFAAPVAAETPAGVEVVPDLPYVGEGADPKQKLDLYLPKGKTAFPTMVFAHGGAWMMGDRKWSVAVGEALAKQGIAVAAISYRLSPRVKHPAHVEDFACAFAWVHAHIRERGGDPNKLFVGGHSAGGHLAALLASNPKYLKGHNLSVNMIRGAVPMSGVYALWPGVMKQVFGDDAAVVRDATPLTHVGAKLPPFLVLYAEDDFKGFGLMATVFAAALSKAGTEAEAKQIDGTSHISIFTGFGKNGDTAAALVASFVAKHAGR